MHRPLGCAILSITSQSHQSALSSSWEGRPAEITQALCQTAHTEVVKTPMAWSDIMPQICLSVTEVWLWKKTSSDGWHARMEPIPPVREEEGLSSLPQFQPLISGRQPKFVKRTGDGRKIQEAGFYYLQNEKLGEMGCFWGFFASNYERESKYFRSVC